MIISTLGILCLETQSMLLVAIEFFKIYTYILLIILISLYIAAAGLNVILVSRNPAKIENGSR